MTSTSTLLVSFVLGMICVPMVWSIYKALCLTVHEETAVVITRFGKTAAQVTKPGLTFWPEKILPWIRVQEVSLKRDYRHYESIHVNDCRGTTIVIDLWIEFRIVSPEKSLFQIEDWESSLQSLLTNSTTSSLGTLEFNQILSNRGELGAMLKADISEETSRWGLEIDLVFISKLSLMPDVSEQLFNTVAARLEKAKADIEEMGRLEAATLEAETSARVSSLVAEAKGQYALGVGRAYQRLAPNHEVARAYRELYEFSLVKPQRTVSFQGFGDQEFSAIEAAMTVPAFEGATAQSSGTGYELKRPAWKDVHES